MAKVHSIRNSRLVQTAVLAAVVALGSPVLAQQPPAAPPQAPASGTDPVLQLSMDQAATMALEANLGLKAERLNLDVASQSIAISKAAYLPIVSFGVSRNSTRRAAQFLPDGTATVSLSDTFSGNGQVVQQLQWYGGQYAVNWSANRFSAPGATSSFNPSLGSALRVDFTQPLLRDFKIDAQRAGLETAERRRVIADTQLEQAVIATDINARLAYLALVAAIERLKVAKENLSIREESLVQARARVAVGASAQIDVIQAEAVVASNREQVIVAQAGIYLAEDNLRVIILDPSRPDYWQLRFEPTDTIQMVQREISVDAAIKNALANRLDLLIERRNLEITDLNLQLGHNNTLPTVDFNLNYNAAGSGGAPGIPTVTERGFATVLNDTFTNAYPAWTFGVSVGYPIGRTAAQATLAQGQVQKRRQELALRDAELQVIREVRDAARLVQNSWERVQATGAALRANEQQLAAEQRRFAVGLSTTLDMQIRQTELAQARNAELSARIDYNRALLNFERVQKTN
jgi:outer membrane protein